MIVVVTAAAETDLEDIGSFIAREDPRRAIAFVTDLTRRCLMLADLPERYPLVPRYERSGVRRLPFGNYLVFYRTNGDKVEVLRVLNASRDYERILFPS